MAAPEWLFTPIDVLWVRDESGNVGVSVPNHWEIASVRGPWQPTRHVPTLWETLDERVRHEFMRLTFLQNAFEPLEGHPFVPSAAERVRVLLHTLNEFKGCFDRDGRRNAEGHRLYENHFKGDKHWFSDSSRAEKDDFRKEMTFPNPDQPGQTLFCPWHGKVKIQQIRIHFSWPVRSDTPLYIAYVGPKITRR